MLSADDPLNLRPRRVVVAGVSGSGKTTLAARIAAITGGEHVEIDSLFHGPGWVPRPEFLDDVIALSARPTWTTEWQYGVARPVLAERAEVMVWLDLPFLRMTLPRVVRRTLVRRIRRTPLWNGNREPPLRTLVTDREHIIRWAVSTRRNYDRLVPEQQRLRPGLVIVRLRSQREVERWLGGALAEAVRE